LKKKIFSVYSKILSGSLDDEKVIKDLSCVGFLYPEVALTNLRNIFRVLKEIQTVSDKIILDIIFLMSESFDPDRALNNIEKFLLNSKTPEKYLSIMHKNEEFLKDIITLFSGSQFLSDFVLKDEKNIDFLIDEKIDFPKEKEKLYKELKGLLSQVKKVEESFSIVRRFKKKEYLRIGLRDFLRKGSFSEIVRELSDVADVCLQCVYEICERELVKRYGEPFYRAINGEKLRSEFAIISLGKLGGRELNFSSDIDILYLYSSDDGEIIKKNAITNGDKSGINIHEFYVKLSQMITKALSEITEDGNIFRVDLRLRPEGKKGDIAYSLRSYEIYYESWGETWERQALIKARVSAGSQSLGEEFIEMIQPFVYRKYLDFTAIEEIKKVKERINSELLLKKRNVDNLKLGYGGIREIEFFVQSFQLIFGGKIQSIIGTNTLITLEKLLEEKFITKDDFTKLTKAYIFFRELENRIQLSYGAQKHIIPEDNYERWILAKKMGIKGSEKEKLASQLIALYNGHVKNVRKIYNSLFYEKEEEESPYFIITSDDKSASIEYLKGFNFLNPEKAISTIILLREGESFSHPSEKGKILFDKLLPHILKEMSLLPEPDLAILNFERFISSGSSRENVYSFMLENDKVRELLLSLFGTSKFLSDILIRYPESFDTILNPSEWTISKSKENLYNELSESLARISLFENKMNEMRKFKNIEELKVGLRDFSFGVDLSEAFKDLSNLADVYVRYALEISVKELSKRYGIPQIIKNTYIKHCPITVMGLGKFGGRELDFGSDLDLIFVYEGEGMTSGGNGMKNSIPNHLYFQKLYEYIYNVIAGITEVGYGYKMDLRLRPEGKKGATFLPLERFDEYFKTRAETWERQALIKSRIVSGDENLGEKFMNIVHKFVYEKRFGKEDISQIMHIRERIENELAMENEFKKDLKLGYGGLVDIEFIVQTLQLNYGGEILGLRVPNTIDAIKILKDKKILNKSDANALLSAYKFLRKIESRLRIVHNTSLHSFEISPKAIESLAVRVGYEKKKGEKTNDGLLREYRIYTENIRKLYKKIFNKLLLSKK
jgi:glutamate-ammonia-ligase adenylyltransferase